MSGEYLELISLNIWHILATAGNLLLLTQIVKKLLFKPVKAVFAQRQAQVDGLYRRAEDAAQKAEQDKTLYREKLERAKEEADAIVKDATRRADRMGGEILAEARREAADSLKRAEDTIAMEKKKAMRELKNQVADISVRIAETALEREIREEDHRRLIDSFIEQL